MGEHDRKSSDCATLSSVRPAFACTVVLIAIVAVPLTAYAFCRTTTSKTPTGYNPADSGCWMQGVPLAWHVDRVPYAVDSAASKQVTLAEATRVADLAFGAWNETTCPDGGAPSIQAYDEGPSSSVPDGSEGDALAEWAYCAESTSCNSSAHDVLVFDDDSWPYNDPVNTLALTTVTYGVNDGAIFEAYTEINSANNTLTTAEPPPEGAFDLQAILTHEAGHFLGLAHATYTTSIMYAYYHSGAIALTSDDIDGICTVYPPQSPESPKGCGCVTAGAAPATTAVAAGLSLAVLGVLRRRRASLRRRVDRRAR